ncbi:MAG TPA: hypothetical protein VL976_13845 [Xanthobacteraceae bacterium]|nr:hypothetical protein [Xanthobacteraceae bacterium]
MSPQLHVAIDVRGMNNDNPSYGQAGIGQHLRQFQANVGISASSAHDFAAKRNVPIKRRLWWITKMTREIAVFDRQHTAWLEAPGHSKPPLLIVDVNDTIIDVGDVLRGRFGPNNLQLSRMSIGVQN